MEVDRHRVSPASGTRRAWAPPRGRGRQRPGPSHAADVAAGAAAPVASCASTCAVALRVFLARGSHTSDARVGYSRCVPIPRRRMETRLAMTKSSAPVTIWSCDPGGDHRGRGEGKQRGRGGAERDMRKREDGASLEKEHMQRKLGPTSTHPSAQSTAGCSCHRSTRGRRGQRRAWQACATRSCWTWLCESPCGGAHRRCGPRPLLPRPRASLQKDVWVWRSGGKGEGAERVRDSTRKRTVRR